MNRRAMELEATLHERESELATAAAAAAKARAERERERETERVRKLEMEAKQALVDGENLQLNERANGECEIAQQYYCGLFEPLN